MRPRRWATLSLIGWMALGAHVASATPSNPGRTPVRVQPRPQPTTRAAAPGELAAIVRTALASSSAKLPKGATITGVRAAAAVELPLAPARVTIDVTPPPRRAGPSVAPAVLSFWGEESVIARVPVSIDLTVPPEALAPDVPKGSALVLVVRRGLVEVTAPAVAGADADVGDVVQVLLRPSGRALRAKIVAKDRAVAVDEVGS
ncbi:MAG: flagella basal body P-ring formation protein FlgA [Labilithrix sp.]|nr:flagella basal body P-ring formation protein FlgA [Labilithrix sp.]